ncbi:MAG: PilN domain-containing protein [Alphaproteobacteria bacterium]|nr:PilN domain-containing protein [Alphaproteobacteria bacterium]
MLSDSFTGGARLLIKNIPLAISWWLRELESLLPKRFASFVQRPCALITLSPKGEQITAKLTNGAVTCALPPIVNNPTPSDVSLLWKVIQEQIGTGRRNALLELSGTDILVFNLEYPAAAASTLDKIISNQLPRISPFSKEQVYWDWKVCDRDDKFKRLHLKVAVAKRETVDSILLWTSKYRIFPDEVLTTREGKELKFSRLLPKNRTLKGHARAVECASNIVIVILGILLVAVFGYRFKRQSNLIDKEIALAEPAVAKAEKIKKHVDLLADIVKEVEKQRELPGKIPILSELTRVFPDSAWLSDLKIVGDEIKATGYAMDPSPLIGLINSDPLFSGAKFLASVTTAGNGKGQRFEISFRVKPLIAP